MEIGFTQFIINPPFPVDRMKGKGAKQTACADDLHCRILLLKAEGKKPLYHFSIDSVEIWKSFRDRMKMECEEVLGQEIDLIVSATHSHLCPFGPTDSAYRDFLVDKISENIQLIEPVKYQEVCYSYHYNYFDKIGNSRVERYASIHLYAETLSLYGDGKRIATILIHNAHPTIEDLGALEFTSEYPGYCISRLRGDFPGEFFTFMLGPAGDISSRYVREGRGYDEIARLSEFLIAEYKEQLAAQNEDSIKPIDKFSYTELTLPLEREPFDIDKVIVPEDLTEEEMKRISHYRETGGWPVPPEEILSEHMLCHLTFSDDYSMIFEPFELYSEYYGAVSKDRCSLITISNGFDHYLTGLYMERVAVGFDSEISTKTRRRLWNIFGRWSRQIPLEQLE